VAEFFLIDMIEEIKKNYMFKLKLY